MLFAEQAHLGRFIPGGYEWSPLSYTPATMLAAKKLAPVEAGAPTVTDVLEAWAAVHERT